jgi:hypothetical protein
MATPPAAPKAGGNVLTRKIGPLATWVWIVLVSVPIVLYGIVERSKTSSTAAASTAASTTASTTNASQVPQFVNQTYTTVLPPSAPQTTAAAPAPAPPSEHHARHNQPPPSTPAPTPTPTQPAPAPVVPTPTPSPSPSGVTEPVPLLTGERANFAIGKLQSLGLGYSNTGPNRNPKLTYDVSAQNPPAGTQVQKGSNVALSFQQVTV